MIDHNIFRRHKFLFRAVVVSLIEASHSWQGDDDIGCQFNGDDEFTKMMLVRRLPLLSRLDVSHCPLITSGGLLRLVNKAPLTHINVAGDLRDDAPIIKLDLGKPSQTPFFLLQRPLSPVVLNNHVADFSKGQLKSA